MIKTQESITGIKVIKHLDEKEDLADFTEKIDDLSSKINERTFRCTV